jgi:hypothetical protein
MKVTLIKRLSGGAVRHSPAAHKELWPDGVNAEFIIGITEGPALKKNGKAATLFYQGKKETSNGWVACVTPSRYGWNFTGVDLIDEEPSYLAFGHLIEKHSRTFLLHIEHDGKERTMLEFAKEVVKQLDLLM